MDMDMDLNIAILAGRLAAPPELRTFDSGATLLRLLLTTRREEPKPRLDVIPVTIWDPAPDLIEEPIAVGRRTWVAGSIQRRFWDAADGRRSRLEIVADQVHIRDAPAGIFAAPEAPPAD